MKKSKPGPVSIYSIAAVVIVICVFYNWRDFADIWWVLIVAGILMIIHFSRVRYPDEETRKNSFNKELVHKSKLIKEEVFYDLEEQCNKIADFLDTLDYDTQIRIQIKQNCKGSGSLDYPSLIRFLFMADVSRLVEGMDHKLSVDPATRSMYIYLHLKTATIKYDINYFTYDYQTTRSINDFNFMLHQGEEISCQVDPSISLFALGELIRNANEEKYLEYNEMLYSFGYIVCRKGGLTVSPIEENYLELLYKDRKRDWRDYSLVQP